MISNNTEGNRYHDEDGKFASAPNSGEAKTDVANKREKISNNFFKKTSPKEANTVTQLKKENPELKAKLKGTIKMLESYRGKPEGTYNLLTGEMVDLSDGFMVTFHQNEADENGHYKSHFGRYTEDEYDNMAYRFAMDNDAEVFVSVFDNEPEISFKVKTKAQAQDLMFKYNQKSIWDNQAGDVIENTITYNPKENPMQED